MRIAVLVSGTGTNLQAILDAAANRALGAEVAVVISNVPQTKAIDRALAAGAQTKVLDARGFPTRDAFDRALAEV